MNNLKIPVTRKQPALLCFVVDMSSSMSRRVVLNSKHMTMAEAVAQMVNVNIYELIESCNKGDEYYDYCHVMVFGYNGHGVCSLLDGVVSTTSDRVYFTVNELVNAKVDKLSYSGRINVEGTMSEYTHEALEFVKAEPFGKTPMYTALDYVYKELVAWLDMRGEGASHVFVINLSDAEATDCNQAELLFVADRIKSLPCPVGKCIFANIILTTDVGEGGLLFPATSDAIKWSHYPKLFYDMSSVLSTDMSRALSKQTDLPYCESDTFRAVAYNTSVSMLMTVLQIGSLSVIEYQE